MQATDVTASQQLKRTSPRRIRTAKQAPAREMPTRSELSRLFDKYDVQIPRYTSYPPATLFTMGYNSSHYLDHISRVNADGGRPEISLYVHLPFCDTLCYFCGCTMMITNNRAKIAEYLTYLKKEITLVRESLESDPVVVQMHWGGGSPTHLTPMEIESLGKHIRALFEFHEDAECSIEIDPRGVTPEHIEAMRRTGFNRASIGVQDFNEDVQVAINRVQPRSVTEQVIEWCREAGIEGINLDLIYGLPYQTKESFLETLRVAKELEPDRLAIYSFAYVPWLKPHQNLIPLDILPVASTKLALLELAVFELTSGDYAYLGMDHFARPDDSLVEAQRAGLLHRNFQGYSTHAGKDLFAFGISGISRVENAFAQNVKSLESYYRMLDEGRLPVERGYQLNADDEVREHVIMLLMCESRVEKTEVERLFAIDFDRYFASSMETLRALEEDGLVRCSSERIEVTSTGRFFLRNIAASFDAYLAPIVSDRSFSRAI